MTDRAYAFDPPPAPDFVSDLGYQPMDRIHAEFQELLLRAQGPEAPDWLPVLEQIDAHMRSHFAAEDGWMVETAFPPRDCHIDEHAAVLKSSAEVLELARQGNFNPAPSFVQALVDWFPGHADHLDSALAAWMCKRQFGGKPVVLHRVRRGQGTA